MDNLLAYIDGRRISHIGSTAVKDILAKPIIDILVEVPPEEDMDRIQMLLTGVGYICMSRQGNRISFCKGYTEAGFAEKVYHLHLRFRGDHPELYFRDYLRDHPETAKAYEQLKISLWKRYEHDRDGYTDAKGKFVLHWTVEGEK